jgi:hypothetical protein
MINGIETTNCSGNKVKIAYFERKNDFKTLLISPIMIHYHFKPNSKLLRF